MKRWLLLLIVCAACLGGCATTKPWQRGQLAEPVMAPDDDEDRQALRQHMMGTREGAIGGFGQGGGGCGCN